MARLFDPGIFSVNDIDGSIGVDWKLFFYTTGTTTQKATYPTRTDALAATNANTNPLIANAGGRFSAAWLTDGDYKIVLKDASDVVKVTLDPIDFDIYGTLQSDGGDIIKIDGGQTLQNWIDGRLTDVRKFGVLSDGSTNDAAAWQDAFDSGEPLWWGGGTSIVGTSSVAGNIYIPDGAILIGAGRDVCRMEKRFFESGTKAMLQPIGMDNSSADGAGCNNVVLHGFTVGCEAGNYSSGGTVSGKLIHTGRNENWLLSQLGVDHWNGFGITLAGRGHRWNDILGSNPNNATGVDLLHIVEQDDEQKPHIGFNLGGQSGDDIFGAFPSASGPFADGNILGALAYGVWGESLAGRVVAIGHSVAGNTGRVANVTVTGMRGKGASATLGTVAIRNAATATAIVENISVEGVLDGTGSQAFLAITGVADTEAGSRMRNISAKIASLNNTTGPSTYGVLCSSQIQNLTLDLQLDCSNVSGAAFQWTNNYGSAGYNIKGWLKAGASDGFLASGSTTFLNGGTIDLIVENLATNMGAMNVAGLRNTTVKLKGVMRSAATGTYTINEGSACQNNLFLGGDFSGTNAPFSTVQTDSAYRSNTGMADLPRQGTISADTTLALSNNENWFVHTSGSAHTLTIPANASVAFPIGTEYDIYNNNGGGNITIAITSDTLRWGSSTGSRTLAAQGTAKLKKVASTTWRLTGDGIT